MEYTGDYCILEDWEREEIRDNLEHVLRSVNSYLYVTGQSRMKASSVLRDALYEPLRYMEWLLCRRGLLSGENKTSKFAELPTDDKDVCSAELLKSWGLLHECMNMMWECDHHKADLEIRDLVEHALDALLESDAYRTVVAMKKLEAGTSVQEEDEL